MSLNLVERTPSRAEYEMLARAVRWDHLVDFSLTERALNASIYCVVAEREGEPIGMARIVGDGVTSFYVQDVIVHPRAQGEGIGDALMQAVFDWVKANAPPRAMIRLFTAEPMQGFYRRMGFDTPIVGLTLPVDKLP